MSRDTRKVSGNRVFLFLGRSLLSSGRSVDLRYYTRFLHSTDSGRSVDGLSAGSFSWGALWGYGFCSISFAPLHGFWRCRTDLHIRALTVWGCGDGGFICLGSLSWEIIADLLFKMSKISWTGNLLSGIPPQ